MNHNKKLLNYLSNYKVMNIITNKIGLSEKQAEWVIGMSEKYAIWIANQIKKNPKIFPTQKAKLEKIITWKKQHPEVNIKEHSFESIGKLVFNSENQWFKAKSKSLKHDKVFADCGDEPFKWIELSSYTQIEEEGNYMRNCLANDYEKEHGSKLFSLRDEFNVPVLTVELLSYKNIYYINQYFGKCNTNPNTKYDSLFSYLESKLSKPVSYLSKYCQDITEDNSKEIIITSDELYYVADEMGFDIETLPENTILKGHVILPDTMERLPKNLIVKGHLDLRESGVSRIPDGTIIEGHLHINIDYMYSINMNKIKVGGKLYFS